MVQLSLGSQRLRSGQQPRPCADEDLECRIAEALKDPKTVVIDARTVNEIVANGFYTVPDQVQWLNAPCFKSSGGGTIECPLLHAAHENLLQDTTVPIVVYCASGKRAGVVQNFLIQKGYENVMNGGGCNTGLLLP